MVLTIEIDGESDGRWIAEVLELGALCYGTSQEEAIGRAKALALQVVADRLENGEMASDLDSVQFKAAA